jgi:hypothetical protein
VVNHRKSKKSHKKSKKSHKTKKSYKAKSKKNKTHKKIINLENNILRIYRMGLFDFGPKFKIGDRIIPTNVKILKSRYEKAPTIPVIPVLRDFTDTVTILDIHNDKYLILGSYWSADGTEKMYKLRVFSKSGLRFSDSYLHPPDSETKTEILNSVFEYDDYTKISRYMIDSEHKPYNVSMKCEKDKNGENKIIFTLKPTEVYAENVAPEDKDIEMTITMCSKMCSNKPFHIFAQKPSTNTINYNFKNSCYMGQNI